jgi:hypothetical protein
MPLLKTTIVPPGNPDTVLNNAQALKFILLVNNSFYAQMADNLSSHPPVADRQVIWFTNGLPPAYQKMFNIPQLGTAVAFTLKLDNTVADIIRNDEIIDYPRFNLAYYNAGI